MTYTAAAQAVKALTLPSSDTVRNHAPCQGIDACLVCGLALNRSAHRLDQGSRSLSPEDGVGSVVEIVEQVLDLWAGVQRVVAVVFQVPVAPVQRP